MGDSRRTLLRMQIPTLTDLQGWLQRNKWIGMAPRAVGPFWVAIHIIGGLALISAIQGLFTQYPSWGLAGAAIFFYFGVRAVEAVEARWRRESLDHKVTFTAPDPPEVTESNGVATVICKFRLQNHADFDIYFVID